MMADSDASRSQQNPQTMRRFPITRGPLCRNFQTAFNLLLTVSWLSVLVYYLLGQWLDNNPKPVWKMQKSQAKPQHIPGSQNKPEVDIPMMDWLGFVKKPRLFPQPYLQEMDLPVFVLTLKQDELYSFHRFLGSFRIHFPEKKLIVYNLGLNDDEADFIRRTCQCLLREVHWERYPPHVKDFSLQAYRPILIQEALQEFGGVFWCNTAMRFNSSFVQFSETFARHYGVAAWPSQEYPTSTFTHHSVFHYFNTTSDLYYFHKMVEPDQALYFNIPLLHSKLMYNWVKCALDLKCIRPMGAQFTGCKMTRKPRYKYAGCHWYDTSVFNVLLGLLFQQDTPYITKHQIFRLEYLQPSRMPVKSWSLGKVKGS